ncbi:MAG: DUF4236 domain-containing protein [Nitrospinales bacterium]
MGFRFFRRIKVAPGVTLNLSKSGGSLSFGRRGVHFTVGPRGRRSTVGIPGTGMFYTSACPAPARRSRPPPQAPEPVILPKDRLKLGFFKSLLTPKDEKAFVDGCRELALGREEQAMRHLETAVHLADGAFLAGFLALKKRRFGKAAEYLQMAAEQKTRLNRYFSKYGISATMSLPITEEVSAHVGPDIRGILLALAEVYQGHGRWAEAIDCLQRLRRLNPDDIVVKLSLAEILLESKPKDFTKKIVKLAEGVANESVLHTALILYKVRALRELGLPEAARDTATEVLRRKKDRPPELLRALCYERALAYEALGRESQARGEFEKLYAQAPDYEDVADRLGLSGQTVRKRKS